MKKVTQSDLDTMRANGAQVLVQKKQPAPVPRQADVDLGPVVSELAGMSAGLQAVAEREVALATRMVEELQKLGADRPTKVRAVVTKRDRQGRIEEMEFELIG